MIRTSKRTILFFILELLTLGLSCYLAFLWVKHPNAQYDGYLTLTGLFFVATELYRRYEGHIFHTEGAHRTPSELIHHSDLLRQQFKEEISRCKREKLRKDAIIRHVKRIGNYPHTKEGKGISSWFKVGLLDTYHRGIKVGLGWEGLVNSPNGLRKPNYKIGENSEYTAMFMGEIPYDSIESVNINGDEYYNYPHIYCHFEHKGQPYERLFYAVEEDLGHGHTFWREIVTYDEVKKNSRFWR